MSDIVELEDVFCVHRTPDGDAAALQGATLAVGRGELVAVIGRSGAGKTTLLRTIAGLQTPSAGSVRIDGHDIGRLGRGARAALRHRLIGFLDQRADSALGPELRVREAMELPLALRNVGGAERRRRARELLDAVGLGERENAFGSELSGGERQRVALCAALAHRPALLLADEPTGELDAASADAVRELIAELARASGTTVIVVSHDPATAAIADRTVTINDGRVAQDRRAGDSDEELVVGRGGWIQLPAELLREAGIDRRARVRRGTEGLLISAVRDRHPVEAPSGPALAGARWTLSSITLDSVTRARGRPVLTGLTETFGPGGLVVVSGPSGAGKTTLLRLLAGLDVPDGGELRIDGAALGSPEQRAAVRRERIGYLSQEPAPVGFLSARENIVLALQLRGWPASEAGERAETVLARVGLSDRARQRVARLSAGEAQRVALARAIASARGLLLVDEPTSRLDERNAAAVAELLATEHHQTVVCATHDPELLRRADRIVELSR